MRAIAVKPSTRRKNDCWGGAEGSVPATKDQFLPGGRNASLDKPVVSSSRLLVVNLLGP